MRDPHVRFNERGEAIHGLPLLYWFVRFLDSYQIHPSTGTLETEESTALPR